MSILDKFTVTPLLYACGALLLVVAGMGVKLKLVDASRDSAVSAKHAAEADTRTARTERDAWKNTASDCRAANKAYDSALTSMHEELVRQQHEAARISVQSQRAVAAAQADALDADRTLKKFTTKFAAESRKPTCARALDAMAAACPALEGF